MRSRRNHRYMPVLESSRARSRGGFPVLWIAAALTVAFSWVPLLNAAKPHGVSSAPAFNATPLAANRR